MANAKTKAADKGAASGEDQSMEEILQSIRKIIAEENDDPVDAGGDGEDDSMPDSDVLELTDIVQDDGSVVNIRDGEGDILDDIDDALAESDDFGDEPVPEEAPIAPPPPPPAAKARPVAAPNPPSDEDEGLVSAVSIAASAEAMRALKAGANIGSLPFVSGETVEGLVMQLLRPMLKEWLDANLPAIVQREVQREVQRVSAKLDKE